MWRVCNHIASFLDGNQNFLAPRATTPSQATSTEARPTQPERETANPLSRIPRILTLPRDTHTSPIPAPPPSPLSPDNPSTLQEHPPNHNPTNTTSAPPLHPPHPPRHAPIHHQQQQQQQRQHPARSPRTPLPRPLPPVHPPPPTLQRAPSDLLPLRTAPPLLCFLFLFLFGHDDRITLGDERAVSRAAGTHVR